MHDVTPQELGGALDQQLLPDPPASLGVAVSGGSDSVALLCLLHDFSRKHGTVLHAVTVDHGLRVEAAEEAACVARLCQQLGIAHQTMRWSTPKPQGNLQNEARLARYHLISEWARARHLGVVALGHTLNDQAETILMRLARGAGVDGLTAMSTRRRSGGVTWLRPLLDVSRDDLRAFLKRRNVTWCDDPSNENTKFDRIKARRALDLLAPLGVNAKSLAQVAFNMSRAREALDRQAYDAARFSVTFVQGAVRIDWGCFDALPEETARRVLLGAIGWISGAPYPPRRKAVLGAIDAVKQGVGATVDGCQVTRAKGAMWVCREYHRVRDHRCGVGELWDQRWRLTGAETSGGVHIGALGADGLQQAPAWRALELPRDILLSTPAVWRGADLVAAPLVGVDRGWQVKFEKNEEAFFAALLSH